MLKMIDSGKISSKIAKSVIEKIDERYHPIPESHFYIPTALVDEKKNISNQLVV